MLNRGNHLHARNVRDSMGPGHACHACITSKSNPCVPLVIIGAGTGITERNDFGGC